MMKQVFAMVAVLFASATFAAEQNENSNVCEYATRDWSTMRGTLVAVSQFHGKNDENIQKIAREALAGSQRFTIGEFEIHYAHGRTGLPPPNDSVCYPREASFAAIRNDGIDAAYQCEATMDVKGTVLSVSCKLLAG